MERETKRKKEIKKKIVWHSTFYSMISLELYTTHFIVNFGVSNPMPSTGTPFNFEIEATKEKIKPRINKLT